MQIFDKFWRIRVCSFRRAKRRALLTTVVVGLYVLCLMTIVSFLRNNEKTNWIERGMTFDLKSCTEKLKTFKGNFGDNLQKLKDLEFPEAEKWIKKLRFDESRSRDIPSFPVLVTGANSKHFAQSQGVLISAHRILLPKYRGLKLIYYDLGLEIWQRKKLEKYCKICEMRNFPTAEELPSHARNWSTYAFKPVIISRMFQEFGHVWWVDASVDFISNNLEEPLDYLKREGTLFFTYHKDFSVAKHTKLQTFSYFQEHPCPFGEYGEIEAGNLLFYDNSVSRVILRKWLSCALTESCIAPHGVKKRCNNTETFVGSCHRYDQSVLSIILRRLYHEQNDYPLVEKPFRLVTVKRGTYTQPNFYPNE